jgi:hypothetical protein
MFGNSKEQNLNTIEEKGIDNNILYNSPEVLAPALIVASTANNQNIINNDKKESIFSFMSTYNKKDNGVKEIGVIAEEIYEALPEVVLKNEEGEIDSVSYGRITAVLIEAIKDLKKEIEELKANR